MPDKCSIDGCIKKASYGFYFNTPSYCKYHGILNNTKWVNVVCKCGNGTPCFGMSSDIRPSC